MITIKRATDGDGLAAEIARSRSLGRRTNFYGAAEELSPLAAEGRILRMPFAGGSYCFLEQEKQFDLYFFLEKDAAPVEIPPLEKPVVLEQVALAGKELSPTAAAWERIGFAPYLQRKRLTLSAKKAPVEARTPLFAKEEEAETILDTMQAAFEPYTSALPDPETLRRDIAQGRVIAAREGDKLLGFLRFGREKKVSVLWQIAVLPQGRGKGIGAGLVRDWIALEKEEAAKFQLWVREDNLPALKLYEKSGFLPDGRIAPVMIKG